MWSQPHIPHIEWIQLVSSTQALLCKCSQPPWARCARINYPWIIDMIARMNEQFIYSRMWTPLKVKSAKHDWFVKFKLSQTFTSCRWHPTCTICFSLIMLRIITVECIYPLVAFSRCLQYILFYYVIIFQLFTENKLFRSASITTIDIVVIERHISSVI